jgi:hypothetical protein
MGRPVWIYLAHPRLMKSLDRLKGTETRRWLDRAFDELEKNPSCGVRIRTELIPKGYVREYSINNLWKHDLPGGWRLLYSIARMGDLTAVVVVEWLPHKEYERRFGY